MKKFFLMSVVGLCMPLVNAMESGHAQLAQQAPSITLKDMKWALSCMTDDTIENRLAGAMLPLLFDPAKTDEECQQVGTFIVDCMELLRAIKEGQIASDDELQSRLGALPTISVDSDYAPIEVGYDETQDCVVIGTVWQAVEE